MDVMVAAAESDVARELKVEFTGTASDYFRIWVVNTLLTIVTLGIYSAWAKVRSRRYLYGNTSIDGFGFDYVAEPRRILLGRLIALPLLLLYLYGDLITLGVSAAALVIFILAAPWLLVRSRRFNLRNTTFKNLRFNFRRFYGRAYVVILLYGFLTALSLGLAYPTWDYRRRQYIIENSAFGDQQFDFWASHGKFYRIAYSAVGIVFLGGVIAGLFGGGLVGVASDPGSSSPTLDNITAGITLTMIFMLYLTAWAYIRTHQDNHVYSHTGIAGNRFRMELEFGRLWWIYVSNIFAVIVSIGLLMPWAVIRLTRYKLSRFTLVAKDDLSEFKRRAADDPDAVGEEIADLFDLEFGF